MITYHQTFDIYHTIYRIMRILEINDFFQMERDRLRIFDFLLVFPHELHNVKVPAGAKNIKNKFKESKYNKLTDNKRVFFQIGKYFDNSVQSLFSYEMLDVEKYKSNIILITNQALARKIAVVENSSLNKEVLDILREHFLKMNLTELKERSGLIEYRYDVFKA
jgi:ABC-three component (ABC-3C) system Middle Component 5